MNGYYSSHRMHSRGKGRWVEAGGKRFFARSTWEANYGLFLEFEKQNGIISEWEHEPETFWFKGIKRGCLSYLPDFKVTNTDGSVEYHEVKGWMDNKSKTKIRRMKKYHPSVSLIVIDGARYKSIARTASSLVPGWIR